MRNNASTLGAAIASVLGQTLHDWELIVVDDGSSDQGGAIVEEYHDQRMREPLSAGLATRLNQAVALSGGELLPEWMPTTFAFQRDCPTKLRG